MTKRRMPARLVATGSVLAGVGLGGVPASALDLDDPCLPRPCLEAPLYVMQWELPPEIRWVRVTLSEIVPYDVTFMVTTMDGTAVAPEDYEPMDRPATIPAGEQFVGIPLRIGADTRPEPAEHFWMVISSPSDGVVIANGRTLVAIMDGWQPGRG